ncbi:MAG: 50S ribosomal protein L11 methyltransferase [Thermodesulfobacteriota bacterium]
MLRSPHTKYDRLFVYYFDRLDLPPVDDPDLIGTWVEDDNAILFFHQAREELVQSICAATGATIIYQAELGYRDWEAGTDIGPFATKHLAIRPVWEEGTTAGDGRREIVLDPSVIFGSGFHATTRLCLETLETMLRESGQRIDRVVDLGTGTGLLAIAAARLGAGQVLAVDNNPMACAVARRNVELNDCRDKVTVVQADLHQGLPDLRDQDLVIANLYRGLLLALFAEPKFWTAGNYLISGFTPGMEGELLAALPTDTVRLLHRGGREMWRIWLLRNRNA